MMEFVYSVLFSAALAVKNGEHLTVDLYEKISEAFSAFLRILEFIVVGAIIVILLYFHIKSVLSWFGYSFYLFVLILLKVPIELGLSFLSVLARKEFSYLHIILDTLR